MNISTWLIFASVALMNIVSPGPAIVFAISNSLAFGLSNVLFSTLGNILGLFVVSSVAMIGLGAVLQTSAPLFLAVKIVGAGYVLYLGGHYWCSRTSIFSASPAESSSVRPSHLHAFTRGALIAVTNPKAILFFTALFPQFITPTRNLFSQFLMLTGTFMFFSFCSLMTYACLARSAKRWFSNEHRVRWFNRCTGCAFIALGLGMLRVTRLR